MAELGDGTLARDDIFARLTAPTLTYRQQQVLRMVAQGRSNLEIAERLGIAESTVKVYAVRMFERLGARTRAHAAALGYEYGLLCIGDARAVT